MILIKIYMNNPIQLTADCTAEFTISHAGPGTSSWAGELAATAHWITILIFALHLLGLVWLSLHHDKEEDGYCHHSPQ